MKHALLVVRLYFRLLLPLVLSVMSLITFLISVVSITNGAPQHAIYWLLFSWMLHYQSKHEP